MPTYQEALQHCQGVLQRKLKTLAQIDQSIAKNRARKKSPSNDKAYQNWKKRRQQCVNGIESCKKSITRYQNLISGKWKDMYK
tara:strand:+ start:118 stop:366 length:249 start_codon:yes stop_codon:yes gene_type:complete